MGVRYSDDPQLRGDYTIYVQLDRVSADIPDGSIILQSPDPAVYVAPEAMLFKTVHTSGVTDSGYEVRSPYPPALGLVDVGY